MTPSLKLSSRSHAKTMDTSSAFAWLKSTVIWARRSTKKASMRDPRRVSNQTWLESTELATIWSQGITGDGGWKTNVFAMAAPIPYAAALLASGVGCGADGVRANRR